jgi:hypothetical protein
MNSPTPQDIVMLVKKIGAATEERRITWDTTSQESVFQAEIGDSYVQIEQSWDQEGEDYYHTISIRNGAGRILDQISSGVYYAALRHLGPVLGYPQDLEKIYKAARWQALKVGDVYKDLLGSL